MSVSHIYLNFSNSHIYLQCTIFKTATHTFNDENYRHASLGFVPADTREAILFLWTIKVVKNYSYFHPHSKSS